MEKQIRIGNKNVGNNCPVFIIAEMSANHLLDFERAVKIIEQAKKCGVDAIKLQTYTPDTMTIDCDKSYFHINQGTIWDGTTLYKLYQSAYTPWEWQPKLKGIAEELGLICFSSPFDDTSVDFLEKLNVPAYKVASFEITDIPLIRKIAKLNKPVILSTGIAQIEDIERAIQVCMEEENNQVILLKCASAYPTPYEDMNLKTISNMKETFGCITGLSDHTMGTATAVAAVAMGAKVIEKHLTLSRKDGGPDGMFSMEPDELKKLVDEIRIVEKAMGDVKYELTSKQKKNREHSRSLFVIRDMKQGECFTVDNVRSIRPGFGMHPMYFENILGKRAKIDIEKGSPLSWELIN
jgi:pseudaminic acid synthase